MGKSLFILAFKTNKQKPYFETTCVSLFLDNIFISDIDMCTLNINSVNLYDN